jgi:porin
LQRRTGARVAASALGVGFALALGAGRAWADDAPASATPPPALKLNVLENLDLWGNTGGGLMAGGTVLSKFRLSATLDGDAFSHPGFKAHIQMFATNGRPFSGDFVGDIQTLSNIEAPVSVRLFDLWAEQTFGDKGSVRVGLIDLNKDFDINVPVGLFIASSDAIGPEISKSGRNGPSIFPVTSLGARGIWKPTKSFTFSAAALDGLSGDPAHPGAFAIARLRRSDGVLLIGQADWNFTQSDDAQASIGVWSYTAPTQRIDPARPGEERQSGVYAFVDGPISKTLSAWVRIGFSNPAVDQVSSFFGSGVVWNAPFPSRKNDQAGLAMARAGLGGPAQRTLGLPDAETSIEATYLFQANDEVSLQPDVQYIVHPASAPHLPNALVIGLRISFTGQYPKGSSDTED